jgi:hypothetical protein
METGKPYAAGHERAMNPQWVSVRRNFLDSNNRQPLSGGFEARSRGAFTETLT